MSKLKLSLEAVSLFRRGLRVAKKCPDWEQQQVEMEEIQKVSDNLIFFSFSLLSVFCV